MDSGTPPSPSPLEGEAPKPPVNIGQKLDLTTRALAQARIDTANAYQAHRLAEAKRRAILRTKDEATGKRQSCEDVAGRIIEARNDPNDEIGKAWLALVAARSRKINLEADVSILDRAHWAEVRNGRMGP